MARHSREESGSGQENYRTDAILISIVVPTRGRPDLLNRCLAALVLQEFNAACFEIIVVDDGPSHATREVAGNWAEHAGRSGPAITYIASAGPHGPAAARNRGWRAARGSIVAFTDDDTVARADWLKKGMAAFEDDSTQAAWGRIVMPLHHVPTDYELDAKGLETAVFVTANCFCRKATLEYLGGFDEQFRFAWREDADLYFRLLRANAEIEHVPAAVIVHPIRPARWGISLSQQKKVLFDALLFKKHPELYRQKIRARPRWDYYLIVLALLACALGLAAGMFALAAAAGALWLVLTMRFCIMRLHATAKTPSHIGEMIVTSVLIPPLAVFWRVAGALKFRTPFI
ncbi:MAG TPA: glycosyltransferase [Burkholderiaceae bacterium]|nr:glycosyltransferase [Burkholderiaceae bacterium]